MMSAARSAATARLSFVIDVPAVVRALGWVAFIVESTTTLPFVLASPLWMCEMVIIVVAGNPLRTISNLAFAAMSFPVESFAVKSVTVAVPLPVASASVIAGFSFAGDRSAVKTNVFAGLAVGAEVVAAATGDVVAAPEPAPPQAAATRPASESAIRTRFIVTLHNREARFWTVRRAAPAG